MSTELRCIAVLYKGIYIKIVVIVNGHFFVDKSVNASKIINLPRRKLLAQTLYPDRMSLGQKNGCAQMSSFPTSHPVDMQALIHNSLQKIGGAMLDVQLLVFQDVQVLRVSFSASDGFSFFF
ncbi:MAG: hypothetical protein H7Z39_09480 [Burkholderiaceae bacterium]|nr:hypothetical protein [Burkholderiaceae bacterium]